MSQSVAETLRQAKAVLLTRGWTQGTFENPLTGEVCAHGAILRAIHHGAEQHAACVLLEQALDEPWWMSVPVWNDRRGRQPEHVLALFDRAIALAEAHERQPDPVPA